MTTTRDTLDAFFAQQISRITDQLDASTRRAGYGRGMDPARMVADSETFVRQAYTRNETPPIPYSRSLGRTRRGF